MIDTETEKTVSFRVFLPDEERLAFKVACAKERTTMSQKSREIINRWLEDQTSDRTTTT